MKSALIDNEKDVAELLSFSVLWDFILFRIPDVSLL